MPYAYSADERRAIHDAVVAERRSGAQPPDLDRLAPGFQLPPLVRGPLTVGDLICWQAGAGPSYRPGALGYRDLLTASHQSVTLPTIGWPVNTSQAHEDIRLSENRGMPLPFDRGAMRFAWSSVLFTNWMGDGMFLRRLRIRLTEPILYGDTTWYHAVVTDRQRIEAGTTVQLRLEGRNQRATVTTVGDAEVLFPEHPSRWLRQSRTAAMGLATDRAADNAETGGTATVGFPARASDAPWPRVDVSRNMHRILHSRLVRRCLAGAVQSPAAIALRSGDAALTYAELADRTVRFAARLRAAGLGPGAVVYVAERSLDSVVALLGILEAGAAFLPLDPGLPAPRVAQLLAAAATDALVAQRGSPPMHARMFAVEDGGDDLGEGIVPAAAKATAPAALACVLFTSGSSGRPKAVEIADDSLLVYLDALGGNSAGHRGRRLFCTRRRCRSRPPFANSSCR